MVSRVSSSPPETKKTSCSCFYSLSTGSSHDLWPVPFLKKTKTHQTSWEMVLTNVKCTVVTVVTTFGFSSSQWQIRNIKVVFKEAQLFKMSPAVFAVTDLCRPVWSSSCTVNMLRYGLRALNDPTVSVMDVWVCVCVCVWAHYLACAHGRPRAHAK